MAQKNEQPYVDRHLKPGWYLYWKHQMYCILPPDKNDPLTLYAENVTTAEVHPFSVTELWLSGDESSPIFAPTREQLEKQIDRRLLLPEVAPKVGIPTAHLAKAEHIISVVEQVKMLVPSAKADLEKQREEELKKANLKKQDKPPKKVTNTEALKEACARLCLSREKGLMPNFGEG